MSTKTWQPPPYPEWVQRVIDEGKCMDIRSVVPLDEQSLLDTAMRATGLSDFGTDEWREPFRVYTKALEEEAELHLIGRLRARMETLLLLEARLRIEDEYKRHPEIDEEEIKAPIIVLGQGRCGSTILQSALGANTDDGTTRQWEMMFPCPPPETQTYWTDPRIEVAHNIATQWYRIQPEILSMTPFGGTQAFEDNYLHSLVFLSVGWLGILGEMPSYDAYAARADRKIALNYHKRVLKLLQWKNPRRHWVLKDVHHLVWVPELLQIYPDARLTWIHRDPVRAMASMQNILGSLQRCSSERTFKYGNQVMEHLKDPTALFNHVIDQIEAGVVPRRQLYNMLYRDFVRDPMAEIEKMYRYHDIPLTSAGRAGIQSYLAEHARDKRPAHSFNIPQGEELAQMRRKSKRYQDYFSVPNE